MEGQLRQTWLPRERLRPGGCCERQGRREGCGDTGRDDCGCAVERQGCWNRSRKVSFVVGAHRKLIQQIPCSRLPQELYHEMYGMRRYDGIIPIRIFIIKSSKRDTNRSRFSRRFVGTLKILSFRSLSADTFHSSLSTRPHYFIFTQVISRLPYKTQLLTKFASFLTK